MDEATLDLWKQSPFGRCIEKATENEARQRAAATDWWRDAHIWRNYGDNRHDTTASRAYAALIAQCENRPVWVLEEARRVMYASWRGVSFDHLREKGRQSRESLEAHERMLRRDEYQRRRYGVSQLRLPSFD